MKLFFSKASTHFKNFQKNLFKVINFIVSLLFYLLGIGITRFVAIFVGKSFLNKSFSKSSWKKTKKINLEKQY
ncbi:MAG: hypothetical protein HN981_02905 [Candidatus Pacebacteria bacterium]|jgi:hypothetical protein|nr:hypothetical protein [Candidatus Paceibacterota bacterium]MBT4652561.1 hypothetical protein [Candidatus Paceibacterota bacterium]MBT6756388.1 hypothetical protein [Candidatus Paceibacterota bacterium]MBT6921317.1 hypothetical protein [Candidatus Paceibacterota bacterium]